jgi:hypothetical protein
MKRAIIPILKPAGMICLILSMNLCGCALWSGGATREDPRTKGEKQHPPMGFPQDQETVTDEASPTKEQKEEPQADQKTKSRELEKGKASLPKKVFRVQFFATQYPDEAAQVSETIKNQLSENAYIDYKAPYYWVRVGDCITREEADILLEKVRNLGYQESWVIEAKTEP